MRLSTSLSFREWLRPKTSRSVVVVEVVVAAAAVTNDVAALIVVTANVDFTINDNHTLVLVCSRSWS